MKRSAREIMESAEFTVELPIAGFAVRCRKISNLELVLGGSEGIRGLAGKIEGESPEERKKSLDDQIEKWSKDDPVKFVEEEFETSCLIVKASAVEPRIVDGDWNEVDRDEEVHISVLAEEVIFLAMNIMKESGMIDEVPEMPFRFKPGVSVSSPDGGELREAADGASEAPAGRVTIEPGSIHQGNEVQGAAHEG